MWRVLTVWLCLCNRKETTELRRELSHQKEEEKKAALQQLSRLKDEEIAASKRGWENIVSELQRQVWPLDGSLIKFLSEYRQLKDDNQNQRIKCGCKNVH